MEQAERRIFFQPRISGRLNPQTSNDDVSRARGQVTKDYIIKQNAVSPDSKVRVSDFGQLADGTYSILVDIVVRKNTERFRVKMGKNGKVQNLVTR